MFPTKTQLINTSYRFYQFQFGWATVPHPQKLQKGGQDAIHASQNLLVIADGVSGWQKFGIDAGIYARKLVQIIVRLYSTHQRLFYIQNPQKLALQAVLQNNQKGSSTISIVTLHPHTGIVRSYHVGDSILGCFYQKKQQILHLQQVRGQNQPYQVFGGRLHNFSQTPSDIYQGMLIHYNYQQIHNGMLLLASDGLWDNVHLSQIKTTLFSSSGNIIDKTRFLMERAAQCSAFQDYQSPFYHKMCRRGYRAQKKGKFDDISLILARIIVH